WVAQLIGRSCRIGPGVRARAAVEAAELSLGERDVEGQVWVAAAGQRAHQLRVPLEAFVELATDLERLCQATLVAHRPRDLREVSRGANGQAVADAHVDVALRVGGARQAFAHRFDRL